MADNTPNFDLGASLEGTRIKPNSLSPLERWLIYGFIITYDLFLTILFVAGFLMGGSGAIILPVIGVLFAGIVSAFHADRWQLIVVGTTVFGLAPAILSALLTGAWFYFLA